MSHCESCGYSVPVPGRCDICGPAYREGYDAAVRDFWRAATLERAATIRRMFCVADPRKERLWDEGCRWWGESGFYEEQYQEYAQLRTWAGEP